MCLGHLHADVFNPVPGVRSLVAEGKCRKIRYKMADSPLTPEHPQLPARVQGQTTDFVTKGLF